MKSVHGYNCRSIQQLSPKNSLLPSWREVKYFVDLYNIVHLWMQTNHWGWTRKCCKYWRPTTSWKPWGNQNFAHLWVCSCETCLMWAIYLFDFCRWVFLSFFFGARNYFSAQQNTPAAFDIYVQQKNWSRTSMRTTCTIQQEINICRFKCGAGVSYHLVIPLQTPNCIHNMN